MSAVASPSRPRAAPPPLPRPARPLLEEPRVLEGDRRLRGEQLERGQPLGGERARDEVVLEVEQGDHLGLPQDGQAEHRARAVPREVLVAGELAGVGGGVVEETRSFVRCT